MGRILAIDYGRKRTGLAVSDLLQIIAGGLATVSGNEVISFLQKYCERELVELFVLGEPYQLNHQASENMQWVLQFKKLLEKAFPSIPIVLVDERFTSSLAKKAILEAGIKKKERRENKGLVDELSATILLQSYLESKRI